MKSNSWEGDYYPRKIENVSKELDRLYYGF